MINKQEIQNLRRKAQKIKPVILVGHKGLTDAVNLEVDRALNDHELLKIHLAGADRDILKEAAKILCDHHHAHHVQTIGKNIILYRKNPEKE